MLYHANNPHGGDVYSDTVALDYSSNTNPFGTAPAVRDAISGVLNQLHCYPDPYCRELTAAISEYEKVPPDYVICGNGAAELIYSYCEAIHPARAAELAPTFSEYSLGLSRHGCVIRRYKLRQENDFLLDEGVLDFLEENRPEALFLCNPNNPTGKIIPTPLLENILSYCGRENIRLFVDECFLDLADEGESLKSFLKDFPQLFILKAFTKSFGMAGVRLGYGICADSSLLEKMSQTVQPWNVSLLAQAAGTAALKETAFLRKTRELIPVERQWMKQELEAIGFWVCDSRANYLLFRGPENLHISLRDFRISIRNCDNYQGLGPGWYRVAVRLHSENIQLISAIRRACGKE